MKNPTKWFSQTALTILLLIALSLNATADEYADARVELVAAYQARNFQAMVVAADKSLIARPEYPGALFNLALAQTLSGAPEDSLQTLRRLLAKGIDYGVADIDEFAAVLELDGWEAYAEDIAALYEPIGRAAVALQLDEDRFVPEGIAIGKDGRFYLGSIYRGQLIRAGDSTELLSDRAGHWSVFGMRFDQHGNLWFASAAVPQLADAGNSVGKSGLFRIDSESGEVTRAVVLPRAPDDQVLGDLVIKGDSIYTTDSLTGALYRYSIDADRYETVVEPGTFGSPQGLVFDDTGDYLYVADYVGGLHRVSLSDGSRERLVVPVTISDHGIDGLYRHENELVAIQNGIRPNRVVAFTLSDDGLAITGGRTLAANLPEFDEPTLGVVRGDDFFFVANSHWNRFDQNNQLPDGLSGPIILKVSLASH
jgi:sugar lactone lactonase YvrE